MELLGLVVGSVVLVSVWGVTCLLVIGIGAEQRVTCWLDVTIN